MPTLARIGAYRFFCYAGDLINTLHHE